MTKIIIEVNGGIVTNVTSNSEVDYIIFDHDNINAGDPFPTEHDALAQDFILKDADWEELIDHTTRLF